MEWILIAIPVTVILFLARLYFRNKDPKTCAICKSEAIMGFVTNKDGRKFGFCDKHQKHILRFVEHK